MTRCKIAAAALGALVTLLTGCSAADNRIVGNQLVREDRWFGDFGVVGSLNEVRIKQGSRLTKLKIVGDANKVFVEDRVPLGKIEIWGENNEVSVPENLYTRESVVGNNSQIIRRPFGAPPPAPPMRDTFTYETPYTPPGGSTSSTAPPPSGAAPSSAAPAPQPTQPTQPMDTRPMQPGPQSPQPQSPPPSEGGPPIIKMEPL